MKVSYFSDRGQRESNQDFVTVKDISDDYKICIIADGMGGYELGEVTAELVSESIVAFLSNSKVKDTKCIQKAINKATLAVRQLIEDKGKKTGATIGGILINRSSATCFWVGDVKVYAFRSPTMLFESTSHSLMNRLIKNGSLSDQEKASKYKHVVTRSIQGDVMYSNADFHIIDELREGDQFLVCSDGVDGVVSNSELLEIMNRSVCVDEVAKKIGLKCNGLSDDNYSIVALKI